MDFGKFHFGRIEIDGVTYERDVVIDRGRIRKHKKKPSKKFREVFGHTPVSVEEEIPWRCRRLVVGTGRYGSLPVMNEVKLEARRRRHSQAHPCDAAPMSQHVTWRMAFVGLGLSASVSMASSVGKISRSTFRQLRSQRSRPTLQLSEKRGVKERGERRFTEFFLHGSYCT